MQISTQNLNKYIISEEVGSTAVTKSSVLSALSTLFLKKNNRLLGVYCVRVCISQSYMNHTNLSMSLRLSADETADRSKIP